MILWSTYTPETLANEKTVRNKIFNFKKILVIETIPKDVGKIN